MTTSMKVKHALNIRAVLFREVQPLFHLPQANHLISSLPHLISPLPIHVHLHATRSNSHYRIPGSQHTLVWNHLPWDLFPVNFGSPRMVYVDKNIWGKKYIPEVTKNSSHIPYRFLFPLTVKNTKFLNETFFLKTLTNFETFGNTYV